MAGIRAYVFKHPLAHPLNRAKCLGFVNGQHRAAITHQGSRAGRRLISSVVIIVQRSRRSCLSRLRGLRKGLSQLYRLERLLLGMKEVKICIDAAATSSSSVICRISGDQDRRHPVADGDKPAGRGTYGHRDQHNARDPASTAPTISSR